MPPANIPPGRFPLVRGNQSDAGQSQPRRNNAAMFSPNGSKKATINSQNFQSNSTPQNMMSHNMMTRREGSLIEDEDQPASQNVNASNQLASVPRNRFSNSNGRQMMTNNPIGDGAYSYGMTGYSSGYGSSYGGYGSGGYGGMGYGGYGGGYGGYGMGYGGMYGMGVMGYGGMGMMMGPLAMINSINYFIMSIGQIFQMLGMSSHALTGTFFNITHMLKQLEMSIRQSSFRRWLQIKSKKSKLLRFVIILASMAISMQGARMVKTALIRYLESSWTSTSTATSSNVNSTISNQAMQQAAQQATANVAALNS